MSNVCESPIEERMLEALIGFGIRGNGRIGVIRPRWGANVPNPAMENIPKVGVWVVPQFQIGNYRVDFLVMQWFCGGAVPDEHIECNDPVCTAHRVFVAVECDGHEWHEKTPEQARRDKARDRQIQASGIPVFRFTGTEILRDAYRCADEIFTALDRAVYRAFMQAIGRSAC